MTDADLAEHLAQQTFVQAHRAFQHGVVPENPQAWLYRIATNAAFSTIRRRRLSIVRRLGCRPAAAPTHTCTSPFTALESLSYPRRCLPCQRTPSPPPSVPPWWRGNCPAPRLFASPPSCT
ncbi:MAG: RNA polymerase sigma factor [Anaerolineae bacterium]